MPCPSLLPSTIPPASPQDLWIRYLAGHRRVAQGFLDDVADYCRDSFDHDTGWVRRLLRPKPIPFLDVSYGVIDAGGPEAGTKCWRLTPQGVAAVDDWIAGRDYWAPIAGQERNQKLVLLVLWGAGCGIPEDHWACRRAVRQMALAEIVPGGNSPAFFLVRQRASTLQTRAIIEKINKLRARDDGWILGAPLKQFEMRHAMAILRWIAEQPGNPGKSYLIAASRRGRGTVGVGRFGLLESSGWTRVRQLCRKGVPGLPGRSREFGLIVSSRSVCTQSRLPAMPLTSATISDLDAIRRTQEVIGRIMAEHPGAVAMTATLWPLNRFMVYRGDHHRAGDPSALDRVSAAGDQHAMLTVTNRIVDGVLWVPGDIEEQPSIWVEYEGGRSRLRTRHHLLAAFAMSSRWGKPITLLFAVTEESRRAVINILRQVVLDAEVTRQAADWPGAQVSVRVVRDRPRDATCPLHGHALFEHVYTAPGQPLRQR
jgi:hypothetical protein